MEATKKCNRCGRVLPLSAFTPKHGTCRECNNELLRAYRKSEAGKEARREYDRKRYVKSHTEAVAAAEAEEKRIKQAFDRKLAAHKRSEMTEPRVTIKIDARTIISVKRAVVERYGGTEAYAEHYRKRLSQFNPY